MNAMNEEAGFSRNGVLLLKMAVVYLLIGLLLGLFMSISGQFVLRPVHTHVNLLGWATLGLTGMVYCLFPNLGANRLANWHVWLHNLGLPVMMLALAFYHLGYKEVEALLAIGSIATVAGLVLFAVNLFVNVEPVRADKTVPKRAAAAVE